MDFTITLTGTAPLLLHSSRLADPLDPTAKALKRVTSKRVKTDEDHEEIARLEHAGSLYFDADIGPYIPAQNIERCLLDAARTRRLGPKVQQGLFIATDVNPLAYKGPRDIDGLWRDENFRHKASVKIGTSRTMRCRPIFREWRTEAHGTLDPGQLSMEELAEIADIAGALKGLGDWRPRFGRFAAVVKAT